MSTSRKKEGMKQGPPPSRGVLAKLRGYFLAGVLVTAPIGITIALAVWVVTVIDNQVVPLIPYRYNPATYIKEYLGVDIGLPGLGVAVLAIVITLIGAFTAGLIGRWVVRLGENLLDRMPIVRSLYKLTKQIFQTVLQNQSNAFRQAVLIEYPRRGLWAIAYLTADSEGELREKLQRDTVNVFLPTTPNPTSGFLLFVPREDIILLDMTVEESVKLLISAGIVPPEDKRESGTDSEKSLS
jgi:uncharacterized membrane protein